MREVCYEVHAEERLPTPVQAVQRLSITDHAMPWTPQAVLTATCSSCSLCSPVWSTGSPCSTVGTTCSPCHAEGSTKPSTPAEGAMSCPCYAVWSRGRLCWRSSWRSPWGRGREEPRLSCHTLRLGLGCGKAGAGINPATWLLLALAKPYLCYELLLCNKLLDVEPCFTSHLLVLSSQPALNGPWSGEPPYISYPN